MVPFQTRGRDDDSDPFVVGRGEYQSPLAMMFHGSSPSLVVLTERILPRLQALPRRRSRNRLQEGAIARQTGGNQPGGPQDASEHRVVVRMSVAGNRHACYKTAADVE